MPAFQKVERINSVSYLDSLSIKSWHDKVRSGIAANALSLANVPDYTVYGVRNSKGTLLGIAAIYAGDQEVKILHISNRDSGREIRTMLIGEIDKLYGKRIKILPDPGTEAFYEYLGWRKVGKEYWSK